MKPPSAWRFVLFLALAALGLGAAHLGSLSLAGDMAVAARAYLDSLSPELRSRASLPFESPRRTDWHFVPRERAGVTFGQMTEPQRIAARNLMRAALSAQGMLKADAIMSLDAVLRELEKDAPSPARDPLAYEVTVFGTPGKPPWGWKVEGHHLSVNFTVAEDGSWAATPSFLGANPAEVRTGARAGQRVLAEEEDLGRELVASLDDAQRKEAVLASEVPREILTAPGRSLDEAPSVGLAYSGLRPDQRAILERLLEEYAGTLRRDASLEQLQRIRDAGMDNVRFAWVGGTEPGRPHYYRISGPTFVVELDNTQDNANHIHTVWHDRDRDFGRDLLSEHYKQDHGSHNQ